MQQKATLENIASYLKRRVHVYNGHWLWTKSCTPLGYGKFEFEGKSVRAHRMSYLTFIGPIPEDKPYVLHKRGICHIRKCICPEHLYCGTHQDNMDDKVADDRCDGGRPPVLPDEFIETIRLRGALGETQASIAKDFGISQVQVGRIINNKQRRGV